MLSGVAAAASAAATAAVLAPRRRLRELPPTVIRGCNSAGRVLRGGAGGRRRSRALRGCDALGR
eukprot:scaffold14009_cov110-Isochrysis_galbana.AAC.4